MLGSILGDKLTPTLRRDIETRLDVLYDDARYQAEMALREFGEVDQTMRFPPECPYSVDQILQRRWYPDPVESKP